MRKPFTTSRSGITARIARYTDDCPCGLMFITDDEYCGKVYDVESSDYIAIRRNGIPSERGNNKALTRRGFDKFHDTIMADYLNYRISPGSWCGKPRRTTSADPNDADVHWNKELADEFERVRVANEKFAARTEKSLYETVEEYFRRQDVAIAKAIVKLERELAFLSSYTW